MTEGLIPALVGVWLAYAAATFVPGPNNIFVATSALLGGRRRGVGAALGVAAGSSVWCVAAVLGLGAALEARPELLPVLKLVSGLVLGVIGVAVLRARTVAEPSPDPGGGAVRGLGISLANPLNVLVWSGFAAAVAGVGPTPAETALFVAGSALMAFGKFGALALVASAWSGPGARTRADLARTVSGAVFLLLGAMVAGT